MYVGHRFFAAPFAGGYFVVDFDAGFFAAGLLAGCFEAVALRGVVSLRAPVRAVAALRAVGAGASSLLCAISDALGGHYFNRVPVTRDHIVNALAKRPQSHKPLQVNTA